MDNLIIIDNKLDTTQYKFEKNFPIDSLNIPTVKDYDRSIEGCFSLGIIAINWMELLARYYSD